MSTKSDMRQIKIFSQQQMRQTELDAQQALREAELADQHEQIKLESEKLNLNKSICVCNLKIQNLAAQMKRYGNTLRSALGRMHTEPIDLPASAACYRRSTYIDNDMLRLMAVACYNMG